MDTDVRISNVVGVLSTMSTKITFDRLRELLHYEPETGLFRWRVDKVSSGGQIVARSGAIAGGLNSIGYWQLVIDRNHYLGHRLAWFYVHGEWPSHQIDHVNRDTSDNRISNLRAATHAQQRGNQKRRKDNTSGIKGVSFHKSSGLWFARCRKGQRSLVAYFKSKEAAAKAYEDFAKEIHGEFARAS